MWTVPRVMVRRTASPEHTDFGGLSSLDALVVVRLVVVPLPTRSLRRLWLPAAGGGRAWAARTDCCIAAVEGPFADDRTSVLPPSNCRVCGTWREGRGGGAVGSLGVLRARRCHLRAGFQQCQSFVEMGTVRCCPLGRTVPCGLCPGCWCGGLHHQSTQTLADSDRWTPSSSSGSSSCLSRPALRADGDGLVGLG